MRAAEIINKALECVDGERDATHGPNRVNFTVTAEVWEWYLTHRQSGPINETDVAEMLALTKLARRMKGKVIADHFVDGIGYTAIAAELNRELK
jgi:hypothetical protein